MSTPAPMGHWIAEAQVATSDVRLPPEYGRTTLAELCATAGIPMRVTGGPVRQIVLVRGAQHYRRPGFYYVGAEKYWPLETRRRALRVLEILARGFHDYAARECVCGHGLFVAGRPPGRPPIMGRAMSAKERMRRWRERHRDS